MIEEFTSRGSGDFRQRYQGTYGWFTTESKQRIIVKLIEVGEYAVTFRDKNRTPFSAAADQGVLFEFMPVERGVYTTDDDVVYVSRRVARQWRRGICAENTSLRSLSKGAMDFSHGILESIFTPRDVKKDIKDWNDGKRIGIALSKQFCIFGNEVKVYNDVIGTLEGDTLKVQKRFSQEVHDLVRDLGVKQKVETVDNV